MSWRKLFWVSIRVMVSIHGGIKINQHEVVEWFINKKVNNNWKWVKQLGWDMDKWLQMILSNYNIWVW